MRLYRGRPKWWPNWSGETAVVVGAGPGATAEPLEPYRGRARFITVNNSIALAPWADVAYGCDARWWIEKGGLPDFIGLKISQDPHLQGRFGVKFIRSTKGMARPDALMVGQPTLGWGGNGGFQAINLCIHFGVRKILLVGFTMHIRDGQNWHANHPWVDPFLELNMSRHRRAVDRAADTLQALGIETVNCTPNSALTRYRVSTLEKEFADGKAEGPAEGADQDICRLRG